MNRDNPFSVRGALALVVLGGALFVALLWMIGSGMGVGSANDGGAHAGGKGLNGFAAFADYVEKRGRTVRRVRDEASRDAWGLLVLTPPADASGEELSRIVEARRGMGPTLVILPKWVAMPLPPGTPGAQTGWVVLGGASTPNWQGFHDDIGVAVSSVGKGTPQWHAQGITGTLPAPEAVLTGSGQALVPLAVTQANGGILAAYVDDDGSYPALDAIAVEPTGISDGPDELYPVVFVFEPDLLNNYGMAHAESARFAERLVNAMAEPGEPVLFDLTLNGHARSANLLTLAFTPPFLAATLCLLLAAIAVGWRAFLRFGPPRQIARAIAFGKRALVANTAALIVRSRRLHLVGAPYAAAARERLVNALAIDRRGSTDESEAAIDRALAARGVDEPRFRQLSGRLAAERDPARLVMTARQLHELERKLIR